MIPIVTPEEMAAVDRAAPEPVEVLIGRAGAAVARRAAALLGGTVGRRVVVAAGKGNNGNDGRDAARRLRRRGARVEVVDVADAPPVLPDADLVVDAAFGTGFRGTYDAPDPSGTPVLAVDVPSGVDGLTGEPGGRVLSAAATVTFAALKPGLVLEPGASLAGDVEVADIGLDVTSARVHLVEAADVGRWLPERPADAHKWRSACWAVAGSPGMTGAAHLVARAAQRAGAGYVRLSSPGIEDDPFRPTEAVGIGLPAAGWDRAVLEGDVERFAAVVVGPGLGLADETTVAVRSLVRALPVPVVVDGDGLTALGTDAAEVLGDRTAPTILTPHDGEYARLTGAPPAADRLASARELASATGAVVLLKGPATVVADPDGGVLVSDAGDARLATAGTGDVLSGVIGGLCASGVEPFHAAAAGAFIHGRCGAVGWARGLVAGDLVDHLPRVLTELTET